MMNDIQRQLLSDRIDDLSRRLEGYKASKMKLEKQLENKEKLIDAAQKELEQLQEGVDW